MKLFTLKRVILGFLITLFISAASQGVDAPFDDFTDGNNEDEFGDYWFYWDDSAGTKALDRPQKAPDSVGSHILVPFTYKHRHAADNPNDTFKIKDYQFTVKEEAGNKYATMPFKFGTKWDCGDYTANPFVGIGAGLIADRKSIDLKTASAVTFRLRSHVNDLKVHFRIETMDIIKDSSYAFFYSSKTITAGTWTPCIVAIPTDLAQPAWAKDTILKASLDKAHAAKISWEVHGEFNPAVKNDTLDLDDIVIKDFEYIAPDVCVTCTKTAPPANGLFHTFEKDPPNATPLATYWYAYDDHEIGGTSSILDGATQNPTSKLLTLQWKPNTGFNKLGTGAAVQLSLGPSVKKANGPGDTVNVAGFIGIGFNVYDSASAKYFNATTGKLDNRPINAAGGSATSLYFEYLADGDFKQVTLEISDSNDVPDKNSPTRKDTRGSGIVWYRNFQKTAQNTWARVEIPFDSLVTHDAWVGYKHIPLDKTALAKIQFKVQGGQGQGGTIQIDNVYFPGIDFGVAMGAKNSMIRFGQYASFNAFYNNGIVRVNWKPAKGLNNGKISLIDTKGMVIKTDRISPVSEVAMDISVKQLPTGVYLVRLNGTDVEGKAVAQQSAITIVK